MNLVGEILRPFDCQEKFALVLFSDFSWCQVNHRLAVNTEGAIYFKAATAVGVDTVAHDVSIS